MRGIPSVGPQTSVSQVPLPSYPNLGPAQEPMQNPTGNANNLVPRSTVAHSKATVRICL
ncbi:hypothetical protein M407DRAFT_32768 [Tulasnella calospora MUT 4182]|uniref:Uncharacterized protein n=1 Tax=Tulasnella calospora MUT 4182 TaxID=1051891 RepID=A0A0C3L7P6_9AGAM|nr:hypothetical protein M407DRAFT_32768 [Tulasnella calospora MUT 4182]